jgi:hypothetical protein
VIRITLFYSNARAINVQKRTLNTAALQNATS